MGGTNFAIISEFCSQIFANSLAFLATSSAKVNSMILARRKL